MLQESTPRNNPGESDVGYAEFRIKRSSIKWLVVFAVVLFVVFLGLLLGSVIISTQLTNDVQVKNGELVSKDAKTVIKTSEGLYTQRVTLDTPLEVVQNVKSISVHGVRNAASGASQTGVFKLQVIGFKRIPGQQLIFHGHTHSANIKADGTVELIQSFTSNNKRSVEVRYGNYAEVYTALYRASNFPVTSITHCDNLTLLDEYGLYRLENDLSCTLTGPLSTFRGLFNGNRKTLNITMNSNGDVGLFQSINNAGIFNLILTGTFTGRGRCAGFAVQARSGASLISNKFHGAVVCNAPTNNGPYIAAPYVAELKQALLAANQGKNITFRYLFSNGTVTTDVGYNPWLGGVFGLATDDLQIRSKYNYFFTKYPNMYQPDMNYFGIVGNVVGANKKKRTDWCNNLNHNEYNQNCWYNYGYWNGTEPTPTYYQCCSGWTPCAGCMFDPDPAFCRFVLCGGSGKRSGLASEVASDKRTEAFVPALADVLRFITIPVIEQPTSTNAT